MNLGPFDDDSMMKVGEALEISEDRTGDFYKFSARQWKRHRYDVKTLSSLSREEIRPNAFALLNKCSRVPGESESKSLAQDFYFICLQDHQILGALRRDTRLTLLPLLVYVFTHELVHIVRFCNFFQRFEISGSNREREENVVHATTYDILKDLSLPRLHYILDSYQSHRVCDLAVS